MSAMLEVEGIQTYYGESHVLHGVTLRVGVGEAVALLGRNGAGKTTVIRSIIGFTPPRAGRVIWEDAAIEGWPPYRIARRGIALVPQGRRIFAPLSVRENLALPTSSLAGRNRARQVAGRKHWTMDEVLREFPQLQERLSSAGGSLSGGEQQMLAVGRALMANPKLILMDEPSEGLSPKLVQRVEEIMRRLRELDSERVYQDVEELARLQTFVAEGLKRFEYALRRKVGDETDRALVSGSEEVPAEFKALVEEYYRLLARTGK